MGGYKSKQAPVRAHISEFHPWPQNGANECDFLRCKAAREEHVARDHVPETAVELVPTELLVHFAHEPRVGPAKKPLNEARLPSRHSPGKRCCDIGPNRRRPQLVMVCIS